MIISRVLGGWLQWYPPLLEKGSGRRDWSNCLLCWWLWCCHGKAQDFRRVCVLLGEVPSCCDLLQRVSEPHRTGSCAAIQRAGSLSSGRDRALSIHIMLYFNLERINKPNILVVSGFGLLTGEGKKNQFFARTPTKRQSKNTPVLHGKTLLSEWWALK